MNFWLHVTVIYPLAAVGALVLAGVVFLITEPGDKAWQECAECGTAGQFPPRGLQGIRLCGPCLDREWAHGGER